MADNKPWPSPLGDRAYHGVVGEYVRAVAPHTEADVNAVLVQALVCLGNAMGRNPHFYVEDDRHGTNLFAAVVGDTAMARKGTSLGRAKRLAAEADPLWGEHNDGEGGLSSAEGLIYAVRDASHNGDRPDHGIIDKRLLAAMGEFAETLAKMKREGNPLSATLRNAWDGRTLRLRTKKPIEATDAHVSVIGHITRADLSELLSSADVFNGFGNRFLWVMAQRSKHLPHGGDLRPGEVKASTDAARRAVMWAEQKPRRIDLDAAARRAWPTMYEELGRSEEGRFGAITDRAEPQVRRLALVYAVLDRSTRVRLAHLRAALEVWRYCEDSAAYLFSDAPTPHGGLEARILRALRRRSGWTGRNEIAQKVFKGEVKGYQLDSLFETLVARGELQTRRVPTKGRPRTEYRVVSEDK